MLNNLVLVFIYL